MSFPVALTDCTVCGIDCAGQPESRSLSIYDGEIRITRRGRAYFSALNDERAAACGQHHALVLTERYLERGTFTPAAHTSPESQPVDAFAELT